MAKEKKKFKIKFNAPVTLSFALICVIALILNNITNGYTNRTLFSVYNASLANPFTYVRMIGHAIGHASWAHLTGNMMMILLLGPILEEKYGSKDILFVMIATAFVTGLVHFLFFKGVMLLGASGIVFAFILLSSVTGIKQGEIPITLILVVILYLGTEIHDAVTIKDNVSQLTHVIGGLTGAWLGFLGVPKN